MKTLMIFLMLFAFTPELMAQRSERYERYQSRPRSERQRFDQNLNKYKSYSPQQKRQAQERWKSFKEKTTPEERAYIREKMRNRRRGGR